MVARCLFKRKEKCEWQRSETAVTIRSAASVNEIKFNSGTSGPA
jgi:hypothetical protein